MIAIEGLSKTFGPIKAVDRVSFEVARGEVLGFLGPNGAGKSTTMKMLTGFLPADEGRAVVCGYDVATHPLEAKRRLGYMPEGAPSYSDMTPRSFLAFIADMRGFSGADKRARIDRAADQTNLADVLEQPIETLSRGYKRRVGLAQALLHDPDVLVLDEPTDGLDPNQKHEVRALIQQMAPHKAIVISTHILEEVEAICSRALIIAHGRVVADGTPASLQARSPRHNGIVIKTSRDAASALAPTLRQVAGVAGVEIEPDGLFVRAASGLDVFDAVRAAARIRATDIREIRQERGRLDDVFRMLTGGASDAEILAQTAA
ncbi:MAG TPA: ABC transporter ATP-binding protein [Alphaproteobacteria bacterium]